MNKSILRNILLLFASCCALQGAMAINVSQWRMSAPIIMKGSPARGLVTCTIPPQVFDAASQQDLSDVRVTTVDRVEIPYVITTSQQDNRREPLQLQLFNRESMPGKQSSVTVDFHRRVLKNSLEIDTGGENFRRAVRIEASDDGEQWQLVDRYGRLVRVSDEHRRAFDRSTVTFPDNDQRYLRITVLNGPGESENIAIEAVTAWRNVSGLPQTETLEPIPGGFVVAQHGKDTEVTLDFGFRNLPLCALMLSFGDKHFFRSVTISGRNAALRTEQVPLEDGGTQTRVVEEPWQTVSEDVLTRFAEGNTPGAITLELGMAKYRYLRVMIDNGNDQPLHVLGATAAYRVSTLAFPPAPSGAYRLYVGNPNAETPCYDLNKYIDRLRQAEGITFASIGKLVLTIQASTPPRSPWSAVSQILLWAVMLAAMGILALLIWRQLRAAKEMLK